MATIFISYCRKERQFVHQFVPLVRRVYGNDCLWFDDDIHGGADWWQMILDEIDKCELFIYLISNESSESAYCQAELREALRLNKPILPVIARRLKLDYPGNIDLELGLILRKKQYVDMSNGFNDTASLNLLHAALKRLLDAPLQKTLPPTSPVPTPEPSVPTRKKERTVIRTDIIISVFAVLLATFALILVLQGRMANDNNTPPPTEIAQIITDTPIVKPPLADFQLSQTAEAQFTQTSATQRVFNLTATEEAKLQADMTQAAAQIASIEAVTQAAQVALFFTSTPTLTWTPSFTPTLIWTPSIIPTDMPSPTFTPSLTPTDTPTLTPTPSFTPTLTWTPSVTPTNTPSYTPTATQSPEELTQSPIPPTATWEPLERAFNSIPMVLVPKGCFIMGGESGNSNEQPAHLQCIDEPFWIGKTEITNAQFGSIGPGCAQWSSAPNQPRNCVDWFSARAFCEAHGSRLPTEAEWEYAARGPDSLIYPWGNEFISSRVVYVVTTDRDKAHTAPVDSQPTGASWVGALGMAGNLREWTNSLAVPYPYDTYDGREQVMGIDPNIPRILRGSAFFHTDDCLYSACRFESKPAVVDIKYGFRCARDAD